MPLAGDIRAIAGFLEGLRDSRAILPQGPGIAQGPVIVCEDADTGLVGV
ncbi:hypothetical protein SDC9_174153 [bioreactor metagenome]|uniref:Uncharacterized protein n=1 Tax=bioreactor metagenome TaxID=1076179 RepID=A0A645GIH9_9ZZZZ